MKRTFIACAISAMLMAGAAGQSPKTPADWVAQLGADNLKDRDAASAALLSLGSKSRDTVRDALDSDDPEVKSRARELWKSLRWLVVPDADADVKKLIAGAEKGPISQEEWQDFVQAHGADAIRLVAEMRRASVSADAANPSPGENIPIQNAMGKPVFNVNGGYETGLRAVLDNAEPMDVARLVAQTSRADERASLNALLGELQPASTPEKTAVNWMQIQIALWNYRKAFNFGHDYSLHTPSYAMVQLSAAAADRGALAGKIRDEAAAEIASESDPDQLCAKLSFYTALFVDLNQKEALDPLYNLVKSGATAAADDASLRRLMEALLSSGMPERAVKALHNVQSPLALYMRSAADTQTGNQPVADADWADAVNGIDALDDSKKKESYYEMGELMHAWHDGRAAYIWQKVLSLAPATTVYDANACFRMGEYLEQQQQYAQAAQFYERGVDIASKVNNGVMIATTSDGRSQSGLQPVLEKIRQLKAQAADEKSLFDKSPANHNGGGQ